MRVPGRPTTKPEFQARSGLAVFRPLIAVLGFLGISIFGLWSYWNCQQAEPDTLITLEREQVLLHPRFLGQLIRTGPPDYRYNCHGWTFTAGRTDLSAEEVEEILQAEQYLEVVDPQIGDIIIYRGTSGVILHSGIVRATVEEGLVLVESKFGQYGRYLHLPKAPRGYISFEYYRKPGATESRGAQLATGGSPSVAGRQRDRAH